MTALVPVPDTLDVAGLVSRGNTVDENGVACTAMGLEPLAVRPS